MYEMATVSRQTKFHYRSVIHLTTFIREGEVILIKIACMTRSSVTGNVTVFDQGMRLREGVIRLYVRFREIMADRSSDQIARGGGR